MWGVGVRSGKVEGDGKVVGIGGGVCLLPGPERDDR